MPLTLPTSGDLNLAGYIGVSDGNAAFGVFPSTLQQGGYQEVPTRTERDEIPLETSASGAEISADGLGCGRRRIGMTVYVIEDDAAYRLVPPGFFGNEGQSNLADWNALSDNDKATYLDPAASFQVQTGPGQTATFGLGGTSDSCWVRIYPEDVDGTLPLAGSAGQIVMKSPDGQPYETEWTDYVAGNACPTSMFSRYYTGTSYAFPGGDTETKTIAELALPGVRSTITKFGYANSDVVAWKVNYKIVFDLADANSDPVNIESWVSDETNSTKFHPGTWTAHETLDTTTGDGRAYSITCSGIILKEQGTSTDLATGENTQLRVAVKTTGSGDVNLLSVTYEVTPMLSDEIATLGTLSLAALQVKSKQAIGNTNGASLTYGAADTADTVPSGPDAPL